MNTKTVRELRSIAKDKSLRGYYKLKKDDLVALLLGIKIGLTLVSPKIFW